MKWVEVIENPVLRDLPFKVELNEWGNIVMSPASNQHGYLQSELASFLRQHKKHGKVITECSVDTPRGVKVADVAWGSDEFIKNNGLETPYVQAPEVCVEIVSPSNSEGEVKEKISLYLSKGAAEVWICEENGHVRFYGYKGEMTSSRFFPDAPVMIEM
ncbi:MAG: Uma2 family endonuclease [Candidatus Latescibacteria bacterium]|nr:Uma2 family endonuclease [Candidatus Latescibacterota bacterium]